MKFVPLSEADKGEPQGFTFVPLGEEDKQESPGLTFVPLEEAKKEEPKKEEPKVSEKPSLLAGTTAPPETEPMGNREITEVGNTPIPALKELPMLDVSKMPTETEKKKAAIGLTPEMSETDKYLRAIKSVPASASDILMQGWMGGARLISDITGSHKEDITGVSKQMENTREAIDKTYEGDYGPRMIKSIGTSVLSNLPTIATGMYAGNVPALTNMFAQSFLQTYDDSRNEGLSVGESTARSTLYGAAEALGESIGLPNLISAAKGVLKGVPTADLAKDLAKYILKEIPGEELTYVMQFLTDKGFGLNPEAGLTQFLEGARDTALVTVGQTALMGGAGLGTNQILKSLRKYHSQGAEGIPTAAEMVKDAGFTFTPKEVQAQTFADDILADAAGAVPDKQTLTQKLLDQFNTGNEKLGSVIEGFKENFDNLKKNFSSAVEDQAQESPEEAKLNTLIERYKDAGMLSEDAEKLAKKTIEEEADGTRPISRTSESSVPVPGKQLGTSTGPQAVEQTGLGGAGTPAATSTGGEGTKLNPLDTGFVWRKDGIDIPIQVVAERVASDSGEREVVALVQGDEVNIPISEIARKPEAKTITQGKRGRKAVEVTPEEAAQKLALRKQQAASARDTSRQVDKLQKTLGETFDPSEYEDMELAKQEFSNFQEAQRQAVEDLYRIANGPQRANAAGKKAKAALDALPADQVQLAKDRVEAKKKAQGAARSVVGEQAEALLRESTNGADNAQYNKFKTVGQALSWIERKGNDFEKALASRLLPFVKNMKVVVVKDINQVPENLRKQFEGANGLYFDGVIYLAESGGINNTVFLHEALHGATIARIDAALAARSGGKPVSKELADRVVELEQLMHRTYVNYAALQLAGEKGLLTPEQQAIVNNVTVFEEQGKVFEDIKEFVAYGMTHPTLQEFLSLMPGKIVGEKSTYINAKTGFSRFVQIIRKMFNMGENYSSAFQDLIIVSDRLLATAAVETVTPREAAQAKKMKVKETQVDKSLKKVAAGRNAEDLAKDSAVLLALKKKFSFNSTLAMYTQNAGLLKLKTLLPALPSNIIYDWTADQIPQLNKLNEHMDYMRGMSSKLLVAVDQRSKKLLAYQKGSLIERIKNKPQKMLVKLGLATEGATKFDALVDMMMTATDLQIDPDIRPLADALANDIQLVELRTKAAAAPITSQPSYKGKINAREVAIRQMYDMWSKLDNQGKALYRMVRNHNDDIFNLNRSLQEERMDMYKIPGKTTDPSTPKGMLAAEIRKIYEASKRLSPYFQFGRNGSYWLQIGKGVNRQFYLAERATDRDSIALAYIAQQQREGKLPTDKTEAELFDQLTEDETMRVGDDINELRKSTYENSDLLKNIFALIDKGDITDSESLKDDIYQMYLMTMPEQSFRKQFLHRKGVAGYSTDIIRNFISSGINSANQLARMKYGALMMRDIEAATDALKGMPQSKRRKLEVYIAEIKKRVDMDVNPAKHGEAYNNYDKLVTKANQYAFLYYMSGAATFIRNSFGFIQFSMHFLAARHGGGNPIKGYARVAKEMSKLMFIWNEVGVVKHNRAGDLQWYAPSFGDSIRTRANPDEQRAYQAMVDRQIADTTRTYDLVSRRRVPPTEYNGVWQTTVNFVSAGMHHTERLIREMTYMMSYRLSRQEGKDHDQAVAQAILDTRDALGDFSTQNKARIFRGPTGKLAFLFNSFPAHVSLMLTRNFYGMMPKAFGNTKDKQEASTIFFGVLTSTLLLAGTVGLPMLSFLLGTIEKMRELMHWLMYLKSGDPTDKVIAFEDKDLMRWYRKTFLPNTFGNTKIGDTPLSEIVEKGVLNAMTGYEFSSGLSLNNLWFHDSKATGSIKDTYFEYLTKLTGAAGAMGESIAGSFDHFMAGRYYKGFEAMFPAFARNMVTAARYANEGAKNPYNEKVIKDREEFTAGNLFAAALGFRTTGLAARLDDLFTAATVQKEIVAEKAKITDNLDKSILHDDDKAFNNALEKALIFSMENPQYRYSPSDIKDAIEKRTKARAQSVRGFALDKKFYPMYQQFMEQSELMLDREAKAARD